MWAAAAATWCLHTRPGVLTADRPTTTTTTPPDFRTTKLGRKATHYLVRGLEAVGVAPKGSLEVATMLERAADGLVAGGKKGIFTPLFFFLVRKPLA
jgi:hypothetical protein